MKSTSNTTYTLDFPMKDGKKIHTFKVAAQSQEEAEYILLHELLECARQLEAEEKERQKAKALKEAK